MSAHFPTGETREFAFLSGMTVEQAWRLYIATVYGDQVLPPDQELEVRQSFISGVAWMLGAMMDVADDDEEKAIAKLENLRVEIAAFSTENAERSAARSHLPPPGMRF